MIGGVGNDWRSQQFIEWAADLLLLDLTQLLQEINKMCAAEVTLMA